MQGNYSPRPKPVSVNTTASRLAANSAAPPAVQTERLGQSVENTWAWLTLAAQQTVYVGEQSRDFLR